MSLVPPPLGLPLVPLAGTADATPLVSVQQYRDVTKDTANDDEDVQDAINDAITMVCQECTRTLAYGQYQESQYVYPNGMVFPSAVPIDPTKGITTAASTIYNPATDTSPGSIIQGWGVWVGFFSPLPSMPVFAGVLPPQTILTYWGGYTQATLPPKLRRLICRIAFKSIATNSNDLVGLPGGVRSLSVSGISLSGGLSAFSITDPQIKKDLRRFRRPQVEAWQS